MKENKTVEDQMKEENWTIKLNIATCQLTIYSCNPQMPTQFWGEWGSSKISYHVYL